MNRQNCNEHGLGTDPLVVTPQVYLFARSNIFFQDLNHTSHLASFPLAQVTLSAMLPSMPSMHGHTSDLLLCTVLYYLFCVVSHIQF